MKRLSHPRRGGFTLLETIVVLAIVALVLTAVYTIAQGTLTLADDVSRAQRREGRMQAFTGFCEQMLANLPPSAVLNLKTMQSGDQYLTVLELNRVPSPFDGTPNCTVTLYTEALPGGGLRLMLSSQKTTGDTSIIRVLLLDDLAECEWLACVPGSRQWISVWNEDPHSVTAQAHPALMKWTVSQGGEQQHRLFWIPPNKPASTSSTGAP